jgi:cation diffusion facilitator family transporter
MQDRIQQAKRITWIGFYVNFTLTAGKLFAGIAGNSAAMVADAIHSLSDFLTDIVVIVFVGLSGKDSDEEHPYGHGKFETFATLIISFVLLLVAIGICWSGVEKILGVLKGGPLEKPSMIALSAAFISIIVKEALYRYTVKIGKAIDSQAVIANAWHHRSDAFSSIGTLLGIGGAIVIGGKWVILDPIAAVVVSFFIGKVAISIGLPSVKELLEAALPAAVEKEILEIIHESPEVKSSHRLRTRKIGNLYAIEVHVLLERDISFVASHDVASAIENRLREKYGNKTLISIHTEPLLKSEKVNTIQVS